jgi:hypothetical protein
LQFIFENEAPEFTVGNLAKLPDGAACLVLTEFSQIIPASQVKGDVC